VWRSLSFSLSPSLSLSLSLSLHCKTLCCFVVFGVCVGGTWSAEELLVLCSRIVVGLDQVQTFLMLFDCNNASECGSLVNFDPRWLIFFQHFLGFFS
jgi:hypothetical protein